MKPQQRLYTGKELIAHAVAVDEFQGGKYIKSHETDRDKGIDPRVLALQEPGGFDATPGPMQQTGAPLDLAVDGSGYFIVKPANGKTALSRRGDFTVSADGTLRDGTGTQPLSVDLEPVTIPAHRKISISGDGIIEIEPLNAPLGQTVIVGQLATTFGSEVPLAKTIDGFVRPIDGSVPAPDNTSKGPSVFKTAFFC